MHPKSIEGVSSSYLCCNCGACKVVCPKDAISFKSTSIGRVYADVNDDCIDCGLCQKVCPTLVDVCNQENLDPFTGNLKSVYVGKATDEYIFNNSQSGGICTALLKHLFETGKIDGALVCRMDYGDPVPSVKGLIVSSVEELLKTQKSKYTPVVMLETLRTELPNYNSLAVVGLGCQLEALTALENSKKGVREKIYCKIGLVCDRTLCGTIQDVYKSYTPHFQSISIDWKCKFLLRKNLHLQYETAPLVISDKDGDFLKFPNSYRFLLKDMFTSPRCRVCPDKLNVCSDIVLGDPWRMPDIDMEYGESVIGVRTERGESIISDAQKSGTISVASRPVEELIKGQLTDERKVQVKVCSEAFEVLHPSVDSHFIQWGVSEATTARVTKAKKEFIQFQKRETESKEEIIGEARRIIRNAGLKNNIVYRGLRKIYRTIKR